MSRPIPSTLHSAAASCNRIELVPARVLGLVWVGWLLAAVGLLALSALSLPLKVAGAGWLLGTGVLQLPRYVWLTGPWGLRAVEWDDSSPGHYRLRMGPESRGVLARPAGCWRLGPRLWLLRFATRERVVRAFVDAAVQAPGPARQLAWRLFGPGRRLPGG